MKPYDKGTGAIHVIVLFFPKRLDESCAFQQRGVGTGPTIPETATHSKIKLSRVNNITS